MRIYCTHYRRRKFSEAEHRRLDSLTRFYTARIVCEARSGVRPSVCPSVSLSHQSNAAAACGGFAAERRTRNRY